MDITKEEARTALASVARTQLALRQALRAHCGHLHLWLWGTVWMIMGLTAHCGGSKAIQRYFIALGIAGGIGSVLIGLLQGRQVRPPVDVRYVRVLVAVLAGGLLWPFVMSPAPANELIFAYIGLLVAQLYVVAGLWFDVYLFRLGLLLAAVILTGLWFFLPVFWLWIALLGGGTLIASGCYVRWLLRC